jgi:hypothetical protein
LKTRIWRIVAILARLVTLEPGIFPRLARLWCVVTDGTQLRLAGIAEEISLAGIDRISQLERGDEIRREEICSGPLDGFHFPGLASDPDRFHRHLEF